MESQSGLGSMIQLKALGPQNEFTSACPSTSPFLKIYKHRFEFSNFQKQVPLPDYKFGDVIRVDIDPRMHGDLLDEVILKCTLPALQGLEYPYYTDSIGHALIEKIEFKVGTVTLDIIDGDWLEIYDNLFLTDNKYAVMSDLVQRGKGDTLGKYGYGSVDIYVPLRLFFENKVGSAFPFCVLSQQRMQINIYTRRINDVVNTTGTNIYDTIIYVADGVSGKIIPKITSVSLIMNEYLIDAQLRDFMKNSPLSYLMKTNVKAPPIQFDGSTDFSEDTTFRYYPDTNAVVSLFTWVFRESADFNTKNTTTNKRFEFSSAMTRAGVYMLGEWIDKIKLGDKEYWRYLQPLMSLPANPRKEIYNWSLSLKNDPRSEQDFGSVDLSRIKGREFYFEFDLLGIDRQPTLWMNITNFLKIENGVIEQFFIY